MPFQFQLEHLPSGYSLNNARRGEPVTIATQGFHSSEDGNEFIRRLEGIPRQLLSHIPGFGYAQESTVDRMLAIVRPDRMVSLYVNAPAMRVEIRAKGSVQAGENITLDHILDVTRLRFNEVDIPNDAGVVVVLSAGWRKGLYYDFAPLDVGGQRRTEDIEVVLGRYYAYLQFQRLFSLSDTAWSAFTGQGWFPFVHLRQTTLQRMTETAGAGFEIDEHLDAIAADMEQAVADRIGQWASHPLLASHQPFFGAAFEHYRNGDFLSASSILFPRIEGVLRTNHFTDAAALGASQANLVASTVRHAPLPAHPNSLLFPEKFRSFLRDVYFANFDPRNPDGLSRHTVAHGVAPASRLDRKGTVVGFLILLQITALLPAAATRSSTS